MNLDLSGDLFQRSIMFCVLYKPRFFCELYHQKKPSRGVLTKCNFNRVTLELY